MSTSDQQEHPSSPHKHVTFEEALTTTEDAKSVGEVLKLVRLGELLCAGGTRYGEEEIVNGKARVPEAEEPESSVGAAPGSEAFGKSEEEQADSAEEEAVVPKRLPNPRQPTKYEVEQHNLAHYPILKLVSPLRPWKRDQ